MEVRMEVRRKQTSGSGGGSAKGGLTAATDFYGGKYRAAPWRCREPKGPALKSIFLLTGGSLLMEGQS